MSAAIKWGLITGMVYVIASLAGTLMGIEEGGSSMAVIGILINLVLFGITFFTLYSGVKEIRDSEKDGFITFGDAFRNGMKIALIAGLIVGAYTLLNMLVINPDAMDKAMESMENMDEEQAEMVGKWFGFMQNPYLVSVFMILYVAFWGVIKSLIAASILKKDPPITTPVV